jgi:dTDP-3,4-didehydro-2,6-dideoxy-alpha-D-glucose 3-reductase
MLKFAVIGCGNIAQKSAIPALINSGVSSISVCIDTNTERGKEITEKYDLPFETSMEEAFRKYSFDAVYISTPNATHKKIIINAANNKKHILCQKPIISNIEEANEVTYYSKLNNVAIMEGFMYQFHSQHKFVNDLIDTGEIGTPFHYQAWFGFPPISPNDFRYNKSLGGGAILDAGSYTIHSARHFFKCEPIHIHSILENEGHDVEVRGTAMLDFGNSRTAHLVFGFNNMYQNKYIIWGTNGVITLDRAFALPPNYESILTLEKQGLKKEILMQPCNHFIEEIKYFAQNVNNHDVAQKWREEFINQIKVIDKFQKAL